MRLAPPPSQTIHWITDDILADAFHRFARVSHTYARHASSTPGPLEARRRHARRRMGLAAAAASNGPPIIDIGAMFGMGAKMPAQPEKSWRWEAPSVPGFGAPPPAMPTPVGMGFVRAKRKEVLEGEGGARKVIRESERAFTALLKGCEGGKEVDEGVMGGVVAFLQSSRDEVKAGNLHTLTKWLRSRIISIGALQTLCQLLLTKARLRTLEMEKLHATFALILTNLSSQDEDIEKSLSAILEALGEEDRHTTLLRLAQIIRTSNTFRTPGTTDKPPPTAQGQSSATTIIRTLFRVLDSCPSLQHPEQRATHPTWSQIYRRLGTLLEPAALASHLCALPRQEMSEVILKFWVRKYLVKASLTSPSNSTPTIDHGVFKRLTSLPPPTPTTTITADPTATVLEKPISTYSTALQNSAADENTDPLITLLVVLAQGKVKYTPFLSSMLRLLAAGQTRREVWRTFSLLRLNRSFGIPGEVARELVLYLSASGAREDLLLAYRVFIACPSLSVLGVPELGLQLIEAGLGSPDRIFRLLNRRTSPSTPSTTTTDPRHSLHPAQIDLAHLIAYHWSLHPSTSARVSFRRVWETYRWLRDRGAPLSPLISRALVRAGVLRQMGKGKNVSLAQLRYVLGIVARVEGDGVAGELDGLVWAPNKLLRGPGAVEKREEVWARRVEERMVKGAKWRLKLWAKRRRGWFDHRGRVVGRQRWRKILDVGLTGVRKLETPWQDVWREEDAGVSERGLREVSGASQFGAGTAGLGAHAGVAVDGAHITAGSSVPFLSEEPMVVYDPAALICADHIAATGDVAADTAQAATRLSVSDERANGEVVVRYILELPEEDGVWQDQDGVELVEVGMDHRDQLTSGTAYDTGEAAAMELASQRNPAAIRLFSADDEVDLARDVATTLDVHQTTAKNPFTSAATYARAVPTTLVAPRDEEGVVRFLGFDARLALSPEDIPAVEPHESDTAEDTSFETHDDTSYDIYSAFAEPVGPLMPTHESEVHTEGYLQADAHLPITLTATNTSLHPSDPDSATVHYVSSLKTARDEAQRQHIAPKAKTAKVVMKKLLATAEQRTGVVTGHHEKKDREVNAAAWRAFGKTMYTKRKKSGYDPYAGK
ncbi:hypothetical protein LTR56_016763 [Elasticomyces elasticus]|nr:hypothetical protein LTR56_016763 [Elasticomyces elasticus]KAK3644901.1 hypothetical protein LTR22_015047 [Elasticomyces elasticus]KAK4923370.1 hypothetical protein LTR49_009440 [Elasticomyces elasticus]KAK5753275.1 hypothetical protein LTS12_016611 [Elasticomyces elasticus]